MELQEALSALEAFSNDRQRKINTKWGAPDNQFGVKFGDIRKVAKQIKTDHDLAKMLWATGQVEARLLATLVCKPKAFTLDELDMMVRSILWSREADWFLSYVIRKHPEADASREMWMGADNRWAARAGWDLTSARVPRKHEGVDLSGLLDRLEADAPDAPEEVQWTMNNTLLAIGIHHAAHRDRAIELGEKLQLFHDYPVSKGCVSPFAPIAIPEMVARQNA